MLRTPPTKPGGHQDLIRSIFSSVDLAIMLPHTFLHSIEYRGSIDRTDQRLFQLLVGSIMHLRITTQRKPQTGQGHVRQRELVCLLERLPRGTTSGVAFCSLLES